jgi:hypothetical protein
MKHESLIKRLEVSCLGLDAVDPLRLLVDDVVAALTQPEQEPVAWKLMPRDATDAMLKAMDKCSTEGYDERLYAGHAASVYMAAWNALDTHPPQRTWVGLTKEEVAEFTRASWGLGVTASEFIRAVEARVKEKNNA